MPPKITIADPANQKSISAFFKRKSPPPTEANSSRAPTTSLSTAPNNLSDPIVIDSDDEDVRPAKRAKLDTAPIASSKARNKDAGRAALQAYRLPTPTETHLPQPGTAFDDYSIGLPAPNLSIQSQEKTAAQKRRHREWQRRVMAPEGLVPRRRSLALDEAEGEGAGDEPADDGDEEDDETAGAASGLAVKYAVPAAKGKSKKKEVQLGPSGLPYTPLEKQFMEIKAKNPDVLLLTEVGYKYKFHGEDAKIASKELGIACFPSRNFYNASIPTGRLHIHVKKCVAIEVATHPKLITRLISQGYKVGVVSQMETPALKKAGDNRNAPFTRELTHLYTAATYVEDPSSASSSNMADDPVLPGSAPPPTNALVAIVEEVVSGTGLDEKVRMALVSIVPSTGEVVWDEFIDTHMRSELETRMTHIQPAELLLPATKLSKPTEKVLNFCAGISKTSSREAIRIERIAKVRDFENAKLYLADFYKCKRKEMNADADMDMDVDGAGDVDEVEHALKAFPDLVICAMAVAVSHLIAFKLDNAFVHRASFSRFSHGEHMLLSGSTLANLEIYRNQTDLGIYGSLMWLIDHTKTRMGRRLMREWIGRPLLDQNTLEARINAVEEMMDSNSYAVEKLRGLLVNMPDLVKGLTRVHYGKAVPAELATILVALARVGAEFNEADVAHVESDLLKSIVASLPTIYEPSKRFLEAFNVKEARDGNLAGMWMDPELYPAIQDAKDCIDICDCELAEHLKEVRKVLKRPSLNYITVSGIENLIEVPMRESKTVPPRWTKISATKTAVRFHSPEVMKMLKEKEQHKETLAAAARSSFVHFQSEIAEHHELLSVTKQLAVVDCLISFAQVACLPGYTKPNFVSENKLIIKGGRHPMVEALREDPYVPFDVDFSAASGPVKIITGPNMSGKSSAVRAIALVVCLAQVGCFVPCDSVTLGVHDAIATRMGASDDLSRGKSTFMVELSETSEILKTVTPRTLVILDELGRGTSTYDGAAIASATLRHLTGAGCNTLFVTHYPMVALELVKDYPKVVSNWHMSFTETKMPDGSSEIVFLYKLTAGLAAASFGVWCAQLAGLPKSVLVEAQRRSDEMKAETERRMALAIMRRTGKLLATLSSRTVDAASSVENAKFLLQQIHT